MTLPPVPGDLSFRLSHFLEAIRAEIIDIDKQLQTEGDETSVGGNTTETFPESYNDITPASLASGTATAAWTSVDVTSYISPGCTHIEVWDHIEIGSDGDNGTIDFGIDGSTVSKHGAKTATAQSNVDTDASTVVQRIPVSSGGLIYYRVTGTLGTDAAWEIMIQGEYIT